MFIEARIVLLLYMHYFHLTQLYEIIYYIIPFCRWRKWGSNREGNLSELTVKCQNLGKSVWCVWHPCPQTQIMLFTWTAERIQIVLPSSCSSPRSCCDHITNSLIKTSSVYKPLVLASIPLTAWPWFLSLWRHRGKVGTPWDLVPGDPGSVLGSPLPNCVILNR